MPHHNKGTAVELHPIPNQKFNGNKPVQHNYPDIDISHIMAIDCYLK